MNLAVVFPLAAVSISSVLLLPLLVLGIACIGLSVSLMQNTRLRKLTGYRLSTLESELELAREELRHSTRIDPLTGLVSCDAVWDDLRYAEVRQERSGQPFSFALARLPELASIRATRGDGAAEELIMSAASAIRSQLRKQDIVCRWGEGEFLLLLPETNADGALVVTDKLRGVLAEQLPQHTGITLGSCVYDGSRPVKACIAATGATPREIIASPR